MLKVEASHVTACIQNINTARDLLFACESNRDDRLFAAIAYKIAQAYTRCGDEASDTMAQLILDTNEYRLQIHKRVQDMRLISFILTPAHLAERVKTQSHLSQIFMADVVGHVSLEGVCHITKNRYAQNFP